MRPTRETIRNNEYAYFVSTQTIGRKSLFRVERWARLLISTIQHYDGTGYKLHAYVVMPDHLHLLITPIESVEKSMQLIKGGFSFRAKRELQWNGEIWQPGFTYHRIRDEEDWQKHLAYIQNNPVNAHLVSDSVHYEFMGLPGIGFPQGLKPADYSAPDVRAEARTLQQKAHSLRVEAEDREDYEIGVAALKECEGHPSFSLEEVVKSLGLEYKKFGQNAKAIDAQRKQQ
jgi:putative transposase